MISHRSYALADSPVGQAAWIYKFRAWTDNDGDPESALTRDEMLDDITLYWLTDTAASSARMYFENGFVPASRVDVVKGTGSGLNLDSAKVNLRVLNLAYPRRLSQPRQSKA